MLRRNFLAGTAAAPAAFSPVPAAAADYMPLGYDTYSIRDFHWKAIQLLDYAARHKLDTLQISSLEEYESLEPAHLQNVKDHAARLGLTIDGGIGCICPASSSFSSAHGTASEYLAKGLRTAKAVGATTMRCFCGSMPDRRGNVPVAKYMEATIAVFRSVRSLALDLGVKMALENHNGDLRAREVRTVLEESGKEFAGCCLDTGNPMWMMEDPQFTLEILGPYTVTTHIRDSAVVEHPRGAAFQWVALGDGCIDLGAWIAGVRKVAPQAGLQLEIITGRPPQMLPYLERDYWKYFPDFPAADFARFLALVKKGRPYQGPMVIGGTGTQPPEYVAALRQQQMTDLERSFEYAKNTLNVGTRWRQG